MSKYGHRPHNLFEAIVNRLGGENAAERFLRGEPIVTETTWEWREEDGIIRFSVTSTGTTGEGWITRLQTNGIKIDYAKKVLRHADFKPTTGVTYEVAVMKGELFADDDRITSKIRAEATRRQFEKPNAEVACLIREKFTDKEIEAMGLVWLITMHEPINVGLGPGLLGASRSDGGSWLHACGDWPDDRWPLEYGFAFVVP